MLLQMSCEVINTELINDAKYHKFVGKWHGIKLKKKNMSSCPVERLNVQ